MVIRDELGTIIRLIPNDGFVRYVDDRRLEWQVVLRNDPCAYCGASPPSKTVDHIVPTATGGERATGLNGTGCCTDCNNIKADIDMLTFLLDRERLLRERNSRTRFVEGRGSLNRGFFTDTQIEMMKGVLDDE